MDFCKLELGNIYECYVRSEIDNSFSGWIACRFIGATIIRSTSTLLCAFRSVDNNKVVCINADQLYNVRDLTK